MTTEEKIKIMQAFVDGKQIQSKWTSSDDINWRDVEIDRISPEPTWFWGECDYRVKPEPKYAPYKNTDEMIDDYCERFGVKSESYVPPIIWIVNEGVKEMVIAFSEKFVRLSYGTSVEECGLEWLFNGYKYLDGSPVGKLVEE